MSSVGLIGSAVGVEEIANRRGRFNLFQLLTNWFQGGPIAALCLTAVQSNPGLREIRAQPDRFSPLVFRLVNIALGQVGHSELIVPDWICGSAIDRLLQSCERVVCLFTLQQDFTL